MGTTVDNIHHWNRKHMSVRTTNVAVKRNVQGLCRSLGSRKRNTKNGVRTKLTLCWSSVESEHLHINSTLFKNVKTFQSRSDNLVYIINSLEDTLSAVASLISVTKFKSLVFPCACSTRNRGTTEDSILKNHIHFHSRISTRVNNLTADYICNRNFV